MSPRTCRAPRNPGFLLHWSHTSYPNLLVPKARPRAAHTPHAGEPCCAEPPPPSLSPLRPSPCPFKCPGELHVPRRPLRTQVRIDLTPGRPSLAKSGEPPPREHVAGESPPPLAPTRNPGRPIRIPRPQLDREMFCSEPRDRDPTNQIRAYPFALSILQKRPCVSL